MKTVSIVHYNTPELTAYTVRSIRKWVPDCRIVILDNSDTLPLMGGMGVEVLDNTKGQLIDFKAWLDGIPDKIESPANNYGSAKHCYSIQWLVDHIDEPFVLMDSDVLVRRDISELWDSRFVFVGDVGRNAYKQGMKRMKVLPFICYLNVPMMREHGITYYNQKYMWDLSQKIPNTRYDTGAWFFREVTSKRLRYKVVSFKKYVHHFGHASWKNLPWQEWIEQNRDCFEQIVLKNDKNNFFMDIEEIRNKLVELAESTTKAGIRLNHARFKYNLDGHCTNVLMSYDEEPTDIEPININDL